MRISASIIDKRGNINYIALIIGYTYFSEGLCRIGEHLYGYIDQSGKLVILFQFEDAGRSAHAKKERKMRNY